MLDGIFQRSINTHIRVHNLMIQKRLRCLEHVPKSQVDASDARSHAMIAANTQSMSNNVKGHLPNIDTMKRGIRCVREGNNLSAPNMQKIMQGDYRIQLQIVRRYAWHIFRDFIGY